MKRLLIVDDHVIVLEGVSKLLASDNGISVSATAGSGPEALACIRKTKLDGVLLDLALPGMNGVETLKQIKDEFPKLPVLIFSMYPEEQYAVRCIKAGAAGYLTKACEKKELLDAVRAITRGQRYLTAKVSDCLLGDIQQAQTADEPHRLLSDREFEVFKGIAAGFAPADMARNMHLSPKTISTYRTRILEKLKLSSNAEVMRYAFDHGLA